MLTDDIQRCGRHIQCRFRHGGYNCCSATRHLYARQIYPTMRIRWECVGTCHSLPQTRLHLAASSSTICNLIFSTLRLPSAASRSRTFSFHRCQPSRPQQHDGDLSLSFSYIHLGIMWRYKLTQSRTQSRCVYLVALSDGLHRYIQYNVGRLCLKVLFQADSLRCFILEP